MGQKASAEGDVNTIQSYLWTYFIGFAIRILGLYPKWPSRIVTNKISRNTIIFHLTIDSMSFYAYHVRNTKRDNIFVVGACERFSRDQRELEKEKHYYSICLKKIYIENSKYLMGFRLLWAQYVWTTLSDKTLWRRCFSSMIFSYNSFVVGFSAIVATEKN